MVGRMRERDLHFLLHFLLHFAENWAKNLLSILSSCRDILAGSVTDFLPLKSLTKTNIFCTRLVGHTSIVYYKGKLYLLQGNRNIATSPSPVAGNTYPNSEFSIAAGLEGEFAFNNWVSLAVGGSFSWQRKFYTIKRSPAKEKIPKKDLIL